MQERSELVGTASQDRDVPFGGATVYAVIYRDGRKRIEVWPYGQSLAPEDAMSAGLLDAFGNHELADLIRRAASILTAA